MNKWYRLLRYDWPLHFVLLLTQWIPDNVPFLAFRGWLAHFFIRICGFRLKLGRYVSFYNPSLISLGDDVYIAHGCRFIADEQIIVGNDVQFGPYSVVVSSNHSRINGSFRHGKARSEPIRIESGCWFGSHVTITAGSNVGAGSLVAAGSVAHGDIPSNVLVGGVPAKVIRALEDES